MKPEANRIAFIDIHETAKGHGRSEPSQQSEQHAYQSHGDVGLFDRLDHFGRLNLGEHHIHGDDQQRDRDEGTETEPRQRNRFHGIRDLLRSQSRDTGTQRVEHVLVAGGQGAYRRRNRRLLDEWRQVDQLLVAPRPAGACDRTVDAVQRAEQNQQLYFVQRIVWRRAAIVAILPSCDHRLSVFHARQRFGSDSTMGEAVPVRFGQIGHEQFHVMVGHGVRIAFQGHVVAVKHQNGRFAAVCDSVDSRHRQSGVLQAENHRVMVVDGVEGGTVTAHGDPGQPDPLP